MTIFVNGRGDLGALLYGLSLAISGSVLSLVLLGLTGALGCCAGEPFTGRSWEALSLLHLTFGFPFLLVLSAISAYYYPRYRALATGSGTAAYYLANLAAVAGLPLLFALWWVL